MNASEEKGLTFNDKKTKFVTIAKIQQQDTLNIRAVQTQTVKKNRYLGTIITNNSDYMEEIRMKI